MRIARTFVSATVLAVLVSSGAGATTPEGSAANDKPVSATPSVTSPTLIAPAETTSTSSPAAQPTPPAEAPATASSAPSAAREAAASETIGAPPPAPIAATSVAPSADELLASRLKDALANVPSTSRGHDRTERQALATFYEGRAWQPVWISANGWLTSKGEALASEIKDADAWGLKAADFDPASFANPSSPSDVTADARAAAEVRIATAALKYARHARGGRAEPLTLSKNLDRKLSLVEPAVVLDGLATGDDPASYLRSLHPQHPQFELLRKAYVAAVAAKSAAAVVPKVPDGPKIAVGTRHPDVAIIRQRLNVAVPAEGGTDAETLYDAELAKAVAAFHGGNRIKSTDGAITPATRRAFNVVEADQATRLLANMEQWRWMPEDLGSYHIWVSIPDFTYNVVKDGQIIHTERIVVGKPDTQTPIFSDLMEFVIFHPEWGVPDSIKIKELLPSLRSSNNILVKQNLRIVYGNRVIDPSTVDWATVDVRQLSFIQGSGAGNVLGVVKFRFPNHHDVYMHDTPSKGLFSQQVRAYSHGCIRVQNPVRLAEFLLAEDKGMSPDRVRALAAPSALKNNQITLSRKIPVHLTYFTATADPDGKVSYRRDLYGHEQRIAMGLDGKAHLIVQPKTDAIASRPAPIASFKEATSSPAERAWMRDVFKF